MYFSSIVFSNIKKTTGVEWSFGHGYAGFVEGSFLHICSPEKTRRFSKMLETSDRACPEVVA